MLPSHWVDQGQGLNVVLPTDLFSICTTAQTRVTKSELTFVAVEENGVLYNSFTRTKIVVNDLSNHDLIMNSIIIKVVEDTIFDLSCSF